MAGFGLRKHTVFEWQGSTFRIERVGADGQVLLESMAGAGLQLVGKQQLLSDYAQGLLKAAAPQASEHTPVVYSRPLSDLSEDAQKALTRRKRYLQAVQADGRPVFTKAYLTPILTRAAQEMGDAHPPSVTTVYRWMRAVQRAQDGRALIPRTDLRGRRSSRQSARVLELLAEATADAFAATPLAKATDVNYRLRHKIAQENQQLINTQDLKAPSLRTVYRLLQQADAYEMAALRDGKASADKRFRINKAGVVTSRILERIEIDHTPLDLFLVDEKTGLPLGRPTLTMAIDHYSRMPWGYHLSFGAPSAAAVVHTLRHGILPKQPPATPIPKLPLSHAWPTYGLPETVYTDNGLEFHGKDLENIALDLGFLVVFCPKHQPRFKGVIERYLKTVNYSFAHMLPGVSFARFHLRGDYDSQKHALLTLGEFTHLFEKWVVDIYAQTLHSGIGTTPWKRWHEGLMACEPRLPADLQALQQRIGLVATRKLSSSGLMLNGLRYGSHALQALLKQYGSGVEVRMVFDPENLGEIQVWGPRSNEPVTAQALDLTYAKGLSLRQHELIRQKAREQGADMEDKSTLQRVRAELAEAVAELMCSRKQKARQRSGAIRGISSTAPQGNTEALLSSRPPDSKASDKAAPAQASVRGHRKTPGSRSSPAKRPVVEALVRETSPLLPAFEMQRVQGDGYGPL